MFDVDERIVGERFRRPEVRTVRVDAVRFARVGIAERGFERVGKIDDVAEEWRHVDDHVPCLVIGRDDLGDADDGLGDLVVDGVCVRRVWRRGEELVGEQDRYFVVLAAEADDVRREIVASTGRDEIAT